MSVLGLIAGDGRFPLEIARAARRSGFEVAAVAFRDVTERALETEVATVCWRRLGELQAALDFLREAHVREAVMAGKVSKTHLLSGLEGLAPDARAAALLSALPDLRDASVLGALAGTLEEEGIRLRPQAELVPELLPAEGILGRVHPTSVQWDDIAYGFGVAKELGALDVGQTVAVQGRSVLAAEAVEGTNEAIRRAGKLGRPGLCIVKVAKPDQDPRFDLPAVGLETLEACAEASAGALAVEAMQTVVLDRAELVRRADERGIAVVAVSGAGPSVV